jgi:probable F420-dependent oxidoreductase
MVGTRGIVDRTALVENARMAESIGYSHVSVNDHLSPQLAPITALTAVAMATERLRLCPLVLNNDLRHPAILAQELASLDRISEGRLVVGLGAGWNEPEYAAAGIQFDPPGTRIARMTEAIGVLRGLFADERFSFDGTFYRIADMDGQPKPIQKPHPPFLIGGTRERMLRLAAREADIVGLDLRQDRESLPDAFPARMDERVAWVRAAAGSRFGQLDLNVIRVIGTIRITPQPLRVARTVASRLTDQTGLTIRPEDVLESPYALIGTVPQLVDKIRSCRERWGINSFQVGWLDEPGVADFAPVIEQLAGS